MCIQLYLYICIVLTVFHFVQVELQKERAVRKELEDRMAGIVEKLSSRNETEKDMHNLRRQVNELQHALTEEKDAKNMLLIQINDLTLDTYEQEVSHDIPCHEDNHIGKSLCPIHHIIKFLIIL